MREGVFLERHFPFRPITLPYPYTSLEPYLDADTVYIHHQKIYTEDVNTLNALLRPYPDLYTWTLEDLVTKRMNLPVVVANTIRSYAGSVYAHELYLTGMSQEGSQEPTGALRDKINETYGSVANFKRLFREAALSILGAGYVWLNSVQGDNLHLQTTYNHDVPQVDQVTPILVLDVWEHAYFSKYQNRRGDYADAWFRLINWRAAEERFAASQEK